MSKFLFACFINIVFGSTAVYFLRLHSVMDMALLASGFAIGQIMSHVYEWALK